jgi:hypothetical protein
VSNLKVDTEDLRDSGAALKLIYSEFKDADDNASKLADVVGHGGLSDKIKDFSLRWEKHRNDMLSNIEELEKIIENGAQELEKADHDLAGNLTSGGGGR